eukprot:6180245-Pleurochrysis_carterae.AAC.1
MGTQGSAEARARYRVPADWLEEQQDVPRTGSQLCGHSHGKRERAKQYKRAWEIVAGHLQKVPDCDHAA